MLVSKPLLVMASNECTVTFHHLPQSKQTWNWKQLQQQTEEPAQADKRLALYHGWKEEINKNTFSRRFMRSTQTICHSVNVQLLYVFWTKLQQAQLNKGGVYFSNSSDRDEAQWGRMHHSSAAKLLAAQRKKPEGDKYWPWPSEDSFNPFL